MARKPIQRTKKPDVAELAVRYSDSPSSTGRETSCTTSSRKARSPKIPKHENHTRKSNRIGLASDVFHAGCRPLANVGTATILGTLACDGTTWGKLEPNSASGRSRRLISKSKRSSQSYRRHSFLRL